ncbi:fumarylacetoacetate hydrolase family protein [Verrucomicrobiia bacterium DG1235]|nr:fumarylacetoacetate hydrolase family protein [Verrucomicrobiae bacterium DG1235]
MVIFFKPNAAISDDLHATHEEPLQYEGEISFGLVGGEFRYVGFGIDLTKRGLQSTLIEKSLPWERCKSFKGSAVFSGFVPLEGKVDELEVELLIDGVRAQCGSVAEMINKPADVLEEIKTFTDLEDYDIVMSGTPKGVGFVKAGSLYEGVIRKNGVELVRSSWRALT